MEQGQPDLADKFTEFQGREGHSLAYILLSFPRVSLLYLSNELFFQEQLQYSPHKMQEG